MRTSWFLVKWGLLLAVLAVAIGVPYLYRRVDERVRCHVVDMFRSHYRDMQVTVRTAELVDGEGIIIRGFSVVEPGVDGPRAELLRIDEVFVSCPTDLQHLLSEDVPAERVVIRRPTLRVTRRPDGSWNVADLLPLPSFNDRPPVVSIENGTVVIFDPRNTPPSTLTLRDVHLTMTPIDGAKRKFEMTFTGDHMRRVKLEGRIDPHRLAYEVDGSVEGLEISPELREALPWEIGEKLAALGALRGDATLGFHVTSGGEEAAAPRFAVTCRLSKGRLNDPRLPYPVTDVRASVSLMNEGFRIEHLFAHSGQSTIRLSCRRAGYEPTSPLSLEAEVRNLEVNRALLDIPNLPEMLREEWHKYRPFGRVHANVKLEFDGQVWSPEVWVQCLDVSFTHYQFPYRVDRGHGTLALKDDVLKINIEAYGGSQPIRLAAEVVHPGPDATGWFEAKGDGLPLDRKLFDALNDDSRKIVAALNPRGTINFAFRSWRDEPGEPDHQYLLIGLNRCAMSYNRFPYALSNIRGTIEGMDGRWVFRDLEATNDTARVTCHGHLLPVAAPGDSESSAAGQPPPKELLLTLTATDLPLEEELRDAMQSGMQHLWDDLKPRGMVDLKDVEIRYHTGRKRLGLSFRAEPKGDTASIEPVHFPYRLEKLRGALVFSDGHVRLEGLRAEHGHVRLAADGLCEFQPDGGWKLSIEGLSVDHLRTDRELIRAMPERMRKAIAGLSPQGPFNLRGRWTLARGGMPEDPLQSSWDLEISFAGLAIRSGVELENMHGGLTLAGGFDGERFHSFGQLALDSVIYRGLQLTQVAGPLWIDDHQALFGAWADRQHHAQESRTRAADAAPASKQRLRPVTGRLFEGTVHGNAWVTLDAESQYGLRVSLADADLARIAQDHISGRQRLRGKVLATLDLRGAGRSLNRLSGQGNIQLQKADVYELPVMLALLKILSIKRPDTNAFGSGNIDYRIAGSHVYFDRIVFSGDAVSLEGNGEMNFDGDIRLNLHPVLGREDRKVALLRGLLGGAGQEFMLIRVSGTLDDPKTERQVFPTVNQALQQLTAGGGGLLSNGSQPRPGTTRRLPRKRY